MKLRFGAVLVFALMAGAANAATMIDVSPPPAVACDPARSDCEMLDDGDASANAAGDNIPPAAIAGLVGLLALAAAFRPRRTRLPEVSS